MKQMMSDLELQFWSWVKWNVVEKDIIQFQCPQQEVNEALNQGTGGCRTDEAAGGCWCIEEQKRWKESEGPLRFLALG